MSVQVEKLEKNMAKLTIEVSAEELDKAIEKVYQKLVLLVSYFAKFKETLMSSLSELRRRMSNPKKLD